MNRRQARCVRARQRLTTAADVTLSPHATVRSSELGFSLDDVLSCVIRPEQTYCAPNSYGPDPRVYQRGAIAVVVQDGDRVVVTVLLRTPDPWVHGVHSRQSVQR